MSRGEIVWAAIASLALSAATITGSLVGVFVFSEAALVGGLVCYDRWARRIDRRERIARERIGVCLLTLCVPCNAHT